MQGIEPQILSILERVTGTDMVRKDLNCNLIEEGLLDSLALVELIVAISEELHISIAPAEVDKNLWNTPQAIVSFVEMKASQK